MQRERLGRRWIKYKSVPRWVYMSVVAERDYLAQRVQSLEYACQEALKKIEERDATIKTLQQENETLRKAVQNLQEKLNKERQKLFVKGDSKKQNSRASSELKNTEYHQLLLFNPNDLKSIPRKASSHNGVTRTVPRKVDRTVHAYPQKCSQCGSANISLCERKTEHFEEDIQINIITTKYIHYYAYCKDCKKVSCVLGENEQPDSYIGPNARALAVAMHLNGIPIEKVCAIFEEAFGIKVSPTSICGWENKAAQNAQPIYAQIRTSIRSSEVTFADETSWYIKGEPYWAWCFTSPPLTYYLIHKLRSSKVLKEFFGDRYDGILISDFYSAYNLLDAKTKGKCLAHLHRHINDIDGPVTKDEEMRLGQIKELFQEATKVYYSYKERLLSYEELQESRMFLEDQMKLLIFEKFCNPKAEKVRKLIFRHFDDLFTFMRFPDIVEPTNNVCERKIRPLVITRKNSYGNKTLSAAQNLFLLKSVVETARGNGVKPFEVILALFNRATMPNIDRVILGKCEVYKQLRFPFAPSQNAMGPPS